MESQLSQYKRIISHSKVSSRNLSTKQQSSSPTAIHSKSFRGTDILSELEALRLDNSGILKVTQQNLQEQTALDFLSW